MMKRSFFSMVGYILTGLILILTLLHYHLASSVDSFTLNDFIENPSCCAGYSQSFMGVYQQSTANGFIVNYNHQPVNVIFNEEYTPPRYGEVLVYGQLQHDGSIKALAVHNYNYNFVIYGISFLASIFVLFSFFKEWKITTSGFVRRS